MVRNVYQDAEYAAAYAALEWDGTYYLVRRDLPGVLRRHVTGDRALDFGCGAGRSTRLLRSHGFDVTGVDIADSMITAARTIDPEGTYMLLAEGDLDRLGPGGFDLVLAAFPFDNIPTSIKPHLFHTLRRLLSETGRIVNIVSSPEIYTHEWTSFSTRDYPENDRALDGDLVRIVTTEFRSGRPAEDVLCTDAGYRRVYGEVGLEVEAIYRPLADGTESWPWVSETTVPPWVIYVLKDGG